jgi:UDP-4-amino-4,6-dideoxy-N-acetyl-beta-L-altrosamine transaminase
MERIPYGKQTITDDDIQAVESVLRSDYLTQGPRVPEFEATVATYHKAKYAVAFSSGTAALHGAYYALGVSNGDEIITSPITFAATANAAIFLGATPVFADIDISTNCIDVTDIEDRITENTKVISPVSLAGYPVDLKSVRKIADTRGLKVLHDASHAVASKRGGAFGMKYADIAVLSFHPVKHVATGEGGMALTNSEEMRDKLILFRSHGITKNEELMSRCDGPWYYEMVDLGYNYRMTDIQAALGVSQFSRIDENIRQRNETALSYDKSFAGIDGLITPPNVGYEILDDASADDVHSWHLYTLRLSDAGQRRALYDYLHKAGIIAQIHYIPLHTMPYYKKKFGYKQGDYPKAEAYYASEISIPMYHEMDDGTRGYVVDTVTSFFTE